MEFPTIQNFFLQLAPGLPEGAWWIPLAALSFLFATAVIDAFTSTIPDALIFIGVVLVTGSQGFYVSWNFAAAHLAMALGFAIAIWALNQSWYYLRGHDALGMGDAKWTLLATACFGLMPVLFAWGAGAVIAVLFLMVMQAIRRQTLHVHFAPFLFAGLCAGLWWLRL